MPRRGRARHAPRRTTSPACAGESHGAVAPRARAPSGRSILPPSSRRSSAVLAEELEEGRVQLLRLLVRNPVAAVLDHATPDIGGEGLHALLDDATEKRGAAER